jgi:outer membrane translocation and assembly module TamA
VGIRIGGRVEQLLPDVGDGRNKDVRSITQAFTDLDAPGLIEQPNFAAYSGFLIVQFPDDLNQLARLGGDVRASYTAVRDLNGRDFGFGRVTLEAQQRVAGFRETDKLTLHQLYSGAGASPGSRVPFYLQETLGGVGEVRSFNDEIIGSDATKATLRGFRDLRFRGPQLLLLQAEYRLKVVGPVDATVFVDAGAIASRRADLTRSRFARNVGVSVSVMTIDATAFRVDVGFGGREGAHVFFSVGPIFRQ